MIHFFNGYFRRCNPLHLQLEFSALLKKRRIFKRILVVLYFN